MISLYLRVKNSHSKDQTLVLTNIMKQSFLIEKCRDDLRYDFQYYNVFCFISFSAVSCLREIYIWLQVSP